MARKDSEHQKRSMSALFRGRAIFKPLNTGRIDENVACIREWVANIFFYTKSGVTVMRWTKKVVISVRKVSSFQCPA